MGYSCDRFRSYDRLGLGRIFRNMDRAGGVGRSSTCICGRWWSIFFVGITYAELTAPCISVAGNMYSVTRQWGRRVLLSVHGQSFSDMSVLPVLRHVHFRRSLPICGRDSSKVTLYGSRIWYLCILADRGNYRSVFLLKINILGAKTAAVLQTVLTCIIGGAGILLIVASVINGNVDICRDRCLWMKQREQWIKMYWKLLLSHRFSLLVLMFIPQAAEEINVPLKKIGKMMILSVVLAVVFYSFVILSVGYVLNPAEIALSQSTTGLVPRMPWRKLLETPWGQKVTL